MRPVAENYDVSQFFGSGATQGVAANPDPRSGMGYYVWLYGNYQPFGHAGLDIGCPVGTPIHSPADGTVLYAGWSEDLPGTGSIRKWLLYYNFGGIITVIQHRGWVSIIAHQSSNDHVHVGMEVREGQLIGLSGNTKTRTTKVAPHVHIEALVHLDYRTDVSKGIVYGRVDPIPFFGGIAAQGTINTTEDEELNKEQNDALGAVYSAVNKAPAAGQLASQGDINIVVARMNALESVVLEALGKKKEPTARLVKGKESDTVYAWDGGTGYRALDYAEFALLMSTGAELTLEDQAKINDATKGN